MNILNIHFKKRDQVETTLQDFSSNYYLIINTASKCGLTPQFDGLEEINKHYGPKGLVTLGFPSGQFDNQELATADQANQFCKINYGVTFPIMDKIEVNGENAAPLFKALKEAQSGPNGKDIQWNFTKFIVDDSGNVLKRFEPKDEPSLIAEYLETLF